MTDETTVTPQAGRTERTTIPILDAPAMNRAFQDMLSRAREAMRRIEQLTPESVSPESVLDAWDEASIEMEDVIGPISILNNVHPDRDVRDAADRCMIEFSSFITELFQNPTLFDRITSVRARTGPQSKLQKDLLESFEDSGVALSEPSRERVRDISDQLAELEQEFERNVRDNDRKLAFRPEECEGLPSSYLERAPRDESGNLLLGFDYPDYHPFMANARNGEARRRYYVAYMSRGTPRNLEILGEMVHLRKELASLYALPSFAHYVTRREMAGSPEAVRAFLDEVASVVREAEIRDLDELRKLKAAMSGEAHESTRVERWDMPYFRERLREERYSIDQESLRQYFPTAATLDWALGVSAELYGIRFERHSVPVWHPDVLYYDVLDRETSDFVGGIYVDLYPREGKYKHAAAWPVRGVSTRVGRKPVSVLVTNFERRGLTHEEVETLLHEFGHVLHGVLSKTSYNEHAGTSVERDFVEAPSQMYEEWARRGESLRTFREYRPDCPEITPELVIRLNEARRFGKGIDFARQHLYATFDMTLAGENPPPVMEAWEALESNSPLGHVPGTEFPGAFGHIAGGYAAGYYGYMWSEVIALDLLSVFGSNLMNPDVGRRFRELILSRGGERPAREMVEAFLGRRVDGDAFFAEIRGDRQ